ncbi:hypothetical protein ACQPW1_10100 [Nocardia sp. CA-128927]|uniref:hypothetical protein n=1 Tax=Nocardia sp. CA-128927 TaxID=3239975 RepID=UPI003D979AE6
MRQPTRADWDDMRTNTAKYAGWTFTVFGRVVDRDEMGTTDLSVRADIDAPASAAITKSSDWGKPLWLTGTSPAFLGLKRNDVFTAVITISGTSTNPKDPKSGYPVASAGQMTLTGRAS